MDKAERKDSKFGNMAKNALKSLAFPIFSIIIAIFVAVFFVMWAKGYSILQYFSALGNLFGLIYKGGFGNPRVTFVTISEVTPLIFTGVANAVAFKCGLFNIGVAGQFILGMLAAAFVGTIPGLNPVIHIVLIILAGLMAGGIWGAIPGYLKAKVGTHEVINTIMMNYISMALANFLILRTAFGVPGKASTPNIEKSAELHRFVSGSGANVSIFLAIAVAIFIFWLLWKTTVGYEIRAVGLNPHGAEYGGINIAKNTVLAMVISGAIAGVGGATQVAGVLHNVKDFMVLPSYGFDGIAVALLAKSNPIGCIASALLFGTLNSSARTLQLNGIPKDIVYLIQAIIIIFVATDYIVKYFSEKKRRGRLQMDNIIIINLLAQTLRIATPLIFAALGGIFSEKSGVVNIGLEGMMVMGAFFGVYGSYITGSPLLGIVFAVVAGGVLGLIHAVLSIHLRADQVISGTAINLFSTALASFLIFKLFNGKGGQTDIVKGLSYNIPDGIKDIPILGKFISELNWFVVLAIILVFVSHYVLYKTPLGLRIRAVGEHPKAADTLGINVYKMRYLCVILSGMLAGLGGAALSLGITPLYREGMVAGRGFIALAAVIFGNWKPFGALGASLLFAFGLAFNIFAQGLSWNLPSEVYGVIPYVLTMLALAGFVGKTTGPLASGKPYEKGSR